VGALPEPQIREWLGQVLLEGLLQQAREAEEQAPGESEAHYRSALEQVPKNADAMIGLARVLLAQECVDQAQQLIAELEDRGFLEPEAEKLKAALGMRAKQGLDVRQIREAAQAEPDNLQRQLELAEALSGAGQYREALDICLALVDKDRAGTGESARQMMIEIFRVLPDDSELTGAYRRKLSMLLY
jgi:putative thioredoxin